MGISPTRSRLSLYFRTFPRQYINHLKVVEFLRDLLRQLRGNPIIVWDGGNMHKGEPIRQLEAYQARQDGQLLPALSVEQIDRVATGHIRRAAAVA
ncbi:MAG TPA: hypothetical protein VG722_11525 [Tepidisphaeraceae bacterium]|nr:hypothetical protein [Tepidisphaeraceae bacterium]